MSEIKSILIPVSGALLAVVIILFSIYIYQVNNLTIDNGNYLKEEVKDTQPYQDMLYRQSISEEENIYEAPILIIYLLIRSQEDVVTIKINKILVSNNGIEIDVTDRSLFQEGFVKTNQKTLLSVVPVYPGSVEYLSIDIMYSIESLENKKAVAKYTEIIKVEYGGTYEVTISIDI